MLREAPLVLVPVALARDRRRSTFELRARDEDITANQAIQERLRTDFGIALPDLSEGDEWLPSDYFANVSETISVKSRWSIDPNAIELGFYSFSKILMIRDLEPAAWGEKSIVDHPLLRGLLMEGFRDEQFPIAEDAPLDELFAPADLVQAVDADFSQTIVIEAVRTGRNIVVQGPPGTGKSQTIANIIAAAVHDGKSVRLWPRKWRLKRRPPAASESWSGPDLPSASQPQRQQASGPCRNRGDAEPPFDFPGPRSECERLKQLRDTLNEVDRRMHTPIGETGITPFEALSRLIKAEECGQSGDPSCSPKPPRGQKVNTRQSFKQQTGLLT